ncbi:MAG: ABC transporter permease [Proteiniphilum sp.]|jgi:phospholipid/cholesterol/gamma-HCH transport system permease protein|nr:ABC transporter permease [Proteiniphilum sp.]
MKYNTDRKGHKKLLRSFERVGEYALLLKRVLAVPDRMKEFMKEFMKGIYFLGVNSIWIVVIISLFIGAAIVLQIALNIDSPMLPRFTVGVVSREIILLEFSSTIMCLILAGKVGSNVASEIGTMRITEQIDALDIMGVNSANYLILPKIVSFVAFMPVLVVFSMFMGLFGGYIICLFLETPSVETYVYGMQVFFRESFIWYSIGKSMLFGFIIASVAAYFGYTAKGGALEVGQASTNSVVMNSVLILVCDLVFTHLVMG